MTTEVFTYHGPENKKPETAKNKSRDREMLTMSSAKMATEHTKVSSNQLKTFTGFVLGGVRKQDTIR